MKVAAIKKALNFKFDSDEQALLAFWTAKVLQSTHIRKQLLKPGRRFSRRIDLDDIEMMFGIDLEDFEDKDALQIVHEASKHLLKTMKKSSLKFPAVMQANLKKIAHLLELNEVEVSVLGFFVLLRSNETFRDITDLAEDLNRRQVIELLCWVLDISSAEMERALSKKGTLFTTGLVKIDSNDVNELKRKVDVMDRVIDLVMANTVETHEFLSAFCKLSSPATLAPDNYPHLERQFKQLIAYLSKNQSQGMNVLIYGPPGTGKTQWVKLIAKTLNKKLYEISSEDSDGDGVGPTERIGLYQLSQRAFKQQQDALVLFDEVEDVFPASGAMFFSPRSRDQVSKSWLNTLLEENPVPAFWVSNQVSQIDPAYIRRFDFVVEVATPPRSVRLQMIQNAFARLPVTKDWQKSLSEFKSLTPALIDKVATVIESSVNLVDHQPRNIESVIVDRLNATLTAQGQQKIQIKPPKSINYSTKLINTTVEIDSLIEGLKHHQSGRICLYGHPGTGKTEFGHYIAEQLDLPILKKRASDLLSPYVGEAEQNIARAFEEARHEGAVLQVDEADSFLQSREGAKQSWEVTQVNELLTQMESFEGIFIATTNLIDRLDSASIRRFDWKLEFKPLTFDQAWQLFQESFNVKGHKGNPAAIQAELRQLNALTPGDFAVVSRKLQFLQKEQDAISILAMLKEEHKYKSSNQQQKGIGFLSPLA